MMSGLPSASKAQIKQVLTGKISQQRINRLLTMSERAIIIGGCGRSGTTLLLSILSCHPQLYCLPEETMALCPDAFHGILYNPEPDLEMPFRLDLLFSQLARAEIPKTCLRWCEKTPRNVLYFRRIIAFFGDGVRLLHIVRDGRDVITSRHPLAPDRFWVPPQRWLQDLAAGRSLEGHPQMLTVRYEDLINHYQTTIQAICTFLQLEFHPNFLRYPETARVQANRSWSSGAQPLSGSGIGRWRRQEYAELVMAFMQIPAAKELLTYYNYL